MMFLQAPCSSMSFLPQYAVHNASTLRSFSSVTLQCLNLKPTHFSRYHPDGSLPNFIHYNRRRKLQSFAISPESDSKHNPESSASADSNVKPKSRSRSKKAKSSEKEEENGSGIFPSTIPRKPRRGRRSEAVAVEDYIRNSLEQTFASIRQQSAEAMENMENVLKEKIESDSSDDDDGEEVEEEEEEEVKKSDGIRRKKKMVVEEEDPNWPLDADVGWGIRASEYFEKYPIKNVVGEDGVEIDWEGEIDDNWVKEINCLEWESFAFHPSPLVVLVFERYNRTTDNWKTLKELEKALQVYWKAEDRLPPRSVKIDINIERDLAYALKVRECPQILFLRGNRVLYREKEFRTADELVQMIAFFYYKAKKPSWIDDKALSRPY